MKERCTLFHRKFTDKKIAVTSLRRLYLKNKIKRKKVRQDKYLPPNINKNFQAQCQQLLSEVQLAENTSRTVIYCDEVLFTKHTW